MRASGILLPVSSLPSKYGIGCFSEEAYEFVDQLARAGQKYWQILPLGPTGYGDSPYQSFSTFAGNPYFIDLDTLKDEKLLTQDEIDACWWCDKQDQVKYDALYYYRFPLLRKAYERSGHKKSVEYQAFLEENEEWLDDITVDDAKKYINEGQFAPGSMLPKVQAAVDFASSKEGRTAMITLLQKAKDGIQGKTGTKIHL